MLMDEQNAAYNVSMAYWVSGLLSAETLRRSFERVIMQNVILRTTYRWDRISGFESVVAQD